MGHVVADAQGLGRGHLHLVEAAKVAAFPAGDGVRQVVFRLEITDEVIGQAEGLGSQLQRRRFIPAAAQGSHHQGFDPVRQVLIDEI